MSEKEEKNCFSSSKTFNLLKRFLPISSLILILLFLLSVSSLAFDFSATVKYKNSTLAHGVNVTIEDPFSNPTNEPQWSNFTNSTGTVLIHNITNSTMATLTVVMFSNHSNLNLLEVGPIIPPMPAQAYSSGLGGPEGTTISLNSMNWTMREGVLLNLSMYNITWATGAFQAYISFGGEITDNKLDWPLKGWYLATDYLTNTTLVRLPKYRNYTISLWSQQSPPKSVLVSLEGTAVSHNLSMNASTMLVNISGQAINATPIFIIEPGNYTINFTTLKAYWLIGGATHMDNQSVIEAGGLNKIIYPNGTYWHEVPANTTLVLCAYGNTSNAFYGGCKNVTVGTTAYGTNITVNITTGRNDSTFEPSNVTKVRFNFYQRRWNGTNNANTSLTGRNYVKIKIPYAGSSDIWWGLETNASGTVLFPVPNTSNVTVKIFTQNAPPREYIFTNVTDSNELNITVQSMDQMEDDAGAALDASFPTFYISNSTCDMPNASYSLCGITNMSNISSMNPFSLMTIGGNISMRMTLPSGVVIHFINVDLLAGTPDMDKPKQRANYTGPRTTSSMEEAWAFGSMVPKEMYQQVMIGVPYNTSVISKDQPFSLAVTKLYSINSVTGAWSVIWNSTSQGGDGNGSRIPTDFSDFANPSIFNRTMGGINCSKTDATQNCYVDLANNMLWFKIKHFSALGPEVASYANLGNITSNQSSYSCWQDAATTLGCTALINLTISPESPLINKNLLLTFNNTPDNTSVQDVAINFEIAWYNGSDWVNQTANRTIVMNGTKEVNVTARTNQFRVNITMLKATSVRWNVTFEINGTRYTVNPWLDSLNLTFPATYNITNNQTQEFNFTLYSNNWTRQTCSLILNGTTYSVNNSVDNGTATVLTPGTNISQGNYTWWVSCNVSGESAARWIYINDTVNPFVATSVSSITSTGAELSVSVSENSTCTYANAGSGSLGTGRNFSATLSSLSADTEYIVEVSCTDRASRTGTGAARFHTLAAGATSSSGGGGGGTITVTTIAVAETPQSVTLDMSDKVTFTVATKKHSAQIKRIYTDHVTIRISSDPFDVDVYPGETKKVDVDNDGTYDLAITVEEIYSSSAKITFTTISEKVPATAPAETTPTEEGTPEEKEVTPETETLPEGEKEALVTPSGRSWLVWAIVILAVIAIVVYLVTKKKK